MMAHHQSSCHGFLVQTNGVCFVWLSGIISHIQHEPGEVSDESDGLHDGWVQRGEPDEGDGWERCLLLAWGEEIICGMLDTLWTQRSHNNFLAIIHNTLASRWHVQQAPLTFSSFNLIVINRYVE